ncbi:helix-turn-helix domain-containing protein [Streptosporangium sandarakinum]|uniref:helix-turn-helix domain-containing protein n=1 Tax=Streptosporangium sandarakinum TaxID=1260955 RepID=UPI0037AD0031
MTYVESGALVAGFGAHVVDRLLARYLPPLLQSTPFTAEQRKALEATRDAIAQAADAYTRQPVAAAATPVAATGPSSTREEITTAEAAVVLGVKERRVRQLAEGGLGRKVGRVWVMDRAAVLAYRDERRSA